MSAPARNQESDWICPHCGYENFRRNAQCRNCQTEKPFAHRTTHHGNGHGHGQGHGQHGRPFSARPSSASHQHASGGSSTRPFFDGIMFKKIPIERLNEHDRAAQFLRAAIELADEKGVTDLVSRLTSRRESGAEALLAAFTGHDAYKSLEFVRASVLPFLSKLDAESVSHGAMKESLDELLCSLLLGSERWLAALEQHCASLDTDDQAVIGWMVLQAVALDSECGREVRKLWPIIVRLVDRFERSGHPVLKKTATEIRLCVMPQTAHATTGTVTQRAPRTVAALSDVPGGRHPNDFENYRDVDLLPPREEIIAMGSGIGKAPYLPGPGTVQSDAALLDRAFRLLRHDLVKSIAEEFFVPPGRDGLKGGKVTQWRRQYPSALMRFDSGFDPPSDEDLPKAKKKRRVDAHFRVDFQHGQDKLALRSKPVWWREHPRFLARGALVAVVGHDHLPSAWGLVSERDEEALGSRQPWVGIMPCSANDTAVMVRLELYDREFTLVQVQASFFAYQPVLNGLKRMTSVPFAEELVQWKAASATTFPKYAEVEGPYLTMLRRIDKEPLATVVTSKKLGAGGAALDPSQSSAVLDALLQRVSLCQGPPGTGKSFVGALVTKAIFDYTKETIVCVCFTNHALDDFLLHLVAHGIDMSHMVRIGSSEKIAKELEPIKLFNIATAHAQTPGEKKEFAILCSSIEELQRKVAELSGSRPDNLLFYLKENEPKWFARFQVEPNRLQNGGFSLKVDKAGGGKLTIWTLLNYWENGKTAQSPIVAELLAQNGRNTGADLAIWSMTHQQRKAQIAEWEKEKDAARVQEFAVYVRQLQLEQAKMKALRTLRQKAALRTRRIIGVTTTGAAQNHDLLAHVCAGVLVVEEACEILESHVLTALSAKPKHLIMIGDHEQLRPKTDTYELQVGHPRGLDFNRSLFERLVRGGYPHVTLNVQHRMHDDIAHIVRACTYPQLQTSARVTDLTHPMPRGLQYRVCWVHHTVPEMGHAALLQANEGDGVASASKVNAHEAQMMARTALYLLQQGYKPDQLVMLTPYLGQLSAIREELQKLNLGGQLSELDEQELHTAQDKAKAHAQVSGQVAPAPATSSKPPAKASSTLKISTVDNYQGEESDIVLASLVRSNSNGDIGFTAQKERVNVLMSRARHGIVLFGNRATLCQSKAGKDQWSKVLQVKLPTGQPAVRIVAGVPVRCAHRELVLATPEAFKTHAPDGGCEKPCAIVMACGMHPCALRCHPASTYASRHAAAECQAEVVIRCDANKHALTIPCRTRRLEGARFCRECEKEKAAIAAQLEKDRIAVAQLQAQLLHAELTQEANMKALEAAEQKRLQAAMLQQQQVHHQQTKAVYEAELQKASAVAMAKMKADQAAYLVQLKADIAAKNAKLPPTLASSSSSAGTAVKPVPTELLTPVKANDAVYHQVKGDFLDSLAHMPAYAKIKFTVKAVLAVQNPRLEKQFDAAVAAMRAQQGEAPSAIKSAYHGTAPANLLSVVRDGLSTGKKGKHDSGWFGAGLYFSEHADYCFAYCSGGGVAPVTAGFVGRVIRFRVLPGRVQQLQELKPGQPKHPHFDSNFSPAGFELVLFDEKACRPEYVIEFTAEHAKGAQFTGSKEQTGGK